MIEQLPSPSDKILAFKLSGKLHDADYKTFVPAIDAAAGTGKVRLLAQFHDFHGWDMHALWDDIKFATTHCTKFERIALVQGDDKTSNNIFQLAVNKDGIIRGNYYDGLLDSTTEVYGSVDKKTQRAAWTIGKKKDRVFEAGVYNLTQSECPCLVHIGTQKTDQMLLVRVEQPKTDK